MEIVLGCRGVLIILYEPVDIKKQLIRSSEHFVAARLATHPDNLRLKIPPASTPATEAAAIRSSVPPRQFRAVCIPWVPGCESAKSGESVSRAGWTLAVSLCSSFPQPKLIIIGKNSWSL